MMNIKKADKKQIEEMTKVVPVKIKDPLDNSRYIIFGKSLRREIARIYYNAGYQKLPENSVVLSGEEYEMLANQYKNLEIKYSNLCDNYRLCKDANETLKQNIIITCNETAEKILRDLYSEATSNVSETVELTTFQIEQLAKQYGVEIKE